MVGNGIQALSALANGALVITANERAASGLRRAYDQQQRASGVASWEPPLIRSWTSWCHGLWRDLLLTGRANALLLNPLQEHALWTQIIADDSASTRSAAGRLAEISAAAWRALGAFRGQKRLQHTGPSGPAPSVDTDAFARWSTHFVRRCREDALLSEAALEDTLADAFDAGDLTPGHTRLLLIGFDDDLSPAQQRLLGAACRSTSSPEVLAIGNPAQDAKLVLAPDDREELHACARWCRQMLSAGLRVAIILPDPDGERAALGRELREALSGDPPESFECPAPFAFGAAGSLAQQPMCAAALDTLRLAAAPIPLERASSLLLSRYFATNLDATPDRDRDDTAGTPNLASSPPSPYADESEWSARAEFDAFDLRSQLRLRPEISLAMLLRDARASRRSARLPVLLAALQKLERRLSRPAPLRRSFGAWAETMRGLLRASGWGAPYGRETPQELHLHDAWDRTLDTLATLDFTGDRVSFDEALAALTRVAGQRVLTVEEANKPIVILSPREAAGSTFDAIWCLRAGATSWPAHHTSHALLPWSLQRELGMPGTDRAKDAQQAAKVFARLRASAPHVVFSYAARSDDASQRAAAALRLMNLRQVDAADFALPLPRHRIVALETVEDTARLSSLPDRVHPGGAEILQAQAACGFRAFAEHRLWSTALRDVGLGLDRGRRGTVVHLALEHLWNEVKSQAQLRSLTHAERHAVIDRAAGFALARSLAQRAIAWDEAYVETQRERLHHLLGSWLDLELRRPEFTVELQERVLGDTRIGPLRLGLRIDRIDMVGDAGVLIDYKTGRAEPQQWTGGRPDAPQLPLYAVLSSTGFPSINDRGDTHLGAVAFASVHAGRGARLHGFAEREELLPGPNAAMEAATFADQIELWRIVLEQLAQNFAEGDALVRPKLYPATCRYCQQRILCRLDTAALEEPEEDPDEILDADNG